MALGQCLLTHLQCVFVKGLGLGETALRLVNESQIVDAVRNVWMINGKRLLTQLQRTFE